MEVLFMCKNLRHLNQFVGHKVELFYHSPTLPYASTYTYGSFNWEMVEDDLCLMDELDDDCKTFVNLNEVKEIANLSEDLYSTVVDLVTDKFTLSICCAEERPIIPACSKCGKKLNELDFIWCVDQKAGFGSIHDGDYIKIKLCDDCFNEKIQ